MINSGESFGISAMRSGGLGNRVTGSGHAYLRETIKDDFLEEYDEDYEEDVSEMVRGSAESGEIFNPINKR